MAVFFFDSSAVVKRYLNEPGSAWVVSCTDPAAGNQLYVAGITGVEVVSAIRRKTLSGGLAPSDAAVAISRFRHDFTAQYQTVQITSALISKAMELADKHALRGYDAVQLAALMDINDFWLALGAPALALISADTALNTAAAAEGLAVDDPNTHP